MISWNWWGQPFINLFHKYLLNTYYVPGTGNIKYGPYPWETYSLGMGGRKIETWRDHSVNKVKYWVSQKAPSCFSVISNGKVRMNFLANPTRPMYEGVMRSQEAIAPSLGDQGRLSQGDNAWLGLVQHCPLEVYYWPCMFKLSSSHRENNLDNIFHSSQYI